MACGGFVRGVSLPNGRWMGSFRKTVWRGARRRCRAADFKMSNTDEEPDSWPGHFSTRKLLPRIIRPYMTKTCRHIPATTTSVVRLHSEHSKAAGPLNRGESSPLPRCHGTLDTPTWTHSGHHRPHSFCIVYYPSGEMVGLGIKLVKQPGNGA